MPDLLVSGMSPEEIAALEARASRHGRTLEEEARHLLHEAAAEQILVTELERATQRLTATLPPRPTTGKPSAPRRRSRALDPTPNRR